MSCLKCKMSKCDLFLDMIDRWKQITYHERMINIQNLLFASESYTPDNWVYQDICVGFSRLYYIIDGEAYYEENGQKIRLKKNHLYITPVKTCFSLYDNPEDRLLHTYSHITTQPAVSGLIELEVEKGTVLEDAVALYRKYIHSEDRELLTNVIQFLLSCIDRKNEGQTVAEKTKAYIDSMETFQFDMERLAHDLGYSREHVTRSFQAAYHIAPKKYFEIGRMNVALRYLQEGKKVCEVAEKMNYASPYSFGKAFKKHFGYAPKKYIAILKHRTEL